MACFTAAPAHSPRMMWKQSEAQTPASPPPPPPVQSQSLARRIQFSPLASPSRHPIRAKPYDEALTTTAGEAARRALLFKAPAIHPAVGAPMTQQKQMDAIERGMLSRTSIEHQVIGQTLPPPAFKQIIVKSRPAKRNRGVEVGRGDGSQAAKRGKTDSTSARSIPPLLAAELKSMHPLLESCAHLLTQAGVEDIETLLSLSEAELVDFIAVVPDLTTLQRHLLKSRICMKTSS